MKNLVIDKYGREIHMDASTRLLSEREDAKRTQPKYNPRASAENKIAREYARRAGVVE